MLTFNNALMRSVTYFLDSANSIQKLRKAHDIAKTDDHMGIEGICDINTHHTVLQNVEEETITLSNIIPRATIITTMGTIGGMVRIRLAMNTGLGRVLTQISMNWLASVFEVEEVKSQDSLKSIHPTHQILQKPPRLQTFDQRPYGRKTSSIVHLLKYEQHMEVVWGNKGDYV